MAENEKKQLIIEVKEKKATLVSQNFSLVGGNNDYEVVFTFDKDWEDYQAKTAVFVYGKSNPVYKVFNGNVCKGIAINNSTMCLIGVFAGNLITTTPACVDCVMLSILDEANGVPQPPTQDVYNQIMELLNQYINAVKGAPIGGTKGQVLKKNSDKDYDYSWQDDEVRDLTDYYTKKQADEKFATPDIVSTKIEEYLTAHPPKDGISPTITIVKIDNGHRVSITDIDGTHTFDVMNGERGERGEQGVKGDNGYTPQREIDYWTPTDQAEMKSYIDAQISPLIDEINGVEEELQMINEGGVE